MPPIEQVFAPPRSFEAPARAPQLPQAAKLAHDEDFARLLDQAIRVHGAPSAQPRA